MIEAKTYYKVTCSTPFYTRLFFYTNKQDMEDERSSRTYNMAYDEVIEELSMPKTKEELVDLLTTLTDIINEVNSLEEDYHLVRAKLAVKEDEKERKKRGSD